MFKINSKEYTVYIESHFQSLALEIGLMKYSSYQILVDNNTKKYCLPTLLNQVPLLNKAKIIELPSGENQKNLEGSTIIWDSLFENKTDRKGLLFNLGGGVITDMGAFSASTYKRGIGFCQIPCTLLAMVDASVGGKTGIDFRGAKNILGTFTPPIGVWVYPPFIQTLPVSELYSGISEVLKHGLIFDRSLFETLEFSFPLSLNGKTGLQDFEKIIIRSIDIKNQIVLEDPFEKGIRKLLNFGHTLGHAFESHSFSGSSPLNHGQAIAMGMVGESYLSKTKGLLSEADLKRIIKVLKNLFPQKPILNQDYKALLEIMLQDKKNESGKINFTLLKQIGQGSINHTAIKEEIYASFQYINSILDI